MENKTVNKSKCKKDCNVLTNTTYSSDLNSLFDEVESMHKRKMELYAKEYPTGILPIDEDDMFYDRKSIEEKISAIYLKLHEVIEYINKK